MGRPGPRARRVTITDLDRVARDGARGRPPLWALPPGGQTVVWNRPPEIARHGRHAHAPPAGELDGRRSVPDPPVVPVGVTTTQRSASWVFPGGLRTRATRRARTAVVWRLSSAASLGLPPRLCAPPQLSYLGVARRFRNPRGGQAMQIKFLQPLAPSKVERKPEPPKPEARAAPRHDPR